MLGVTKCLGGQIASTLLPKIDDISGLIEKNDHLFLRDPRLAFQSGLKFFPCIFSWPKKVRTQRYGSMSWYHLIKPKPYVLLHPYELQNQPWLLHLLPLMLHQILTHFNITLLNIQVNGSLAWTTIDHEPSKLDKQYTNNIVL